jgi:hypothetical protein
MSGLCIGRKGGKAGKTSTFVPNKGIKGKE